MARGQLEHDGAAHAVPDEDGAVDADLPAHPGHVVREPQDGVLLLRRVALTMTAQVDGEDPVIAFEVLDLGREARCGRTTSRARTRTACRRCPIPRTRASFHHNQAHAWSLLWSNGHMASSDPVQPLYPALDPQRHGSNLAAAVVAAIEEEIVRRGWPVGTVIATEAELLERFDVSSPVLRQAVGILESNQVARMRRGPGGGLVVTAPNETSVGNSVALYLEYLRVRPELVSEARAAVEIACVELAAARITESDVAPLRALVDAEADRALRGDYDSLADVHVAIGELSGNPVLSLFQKMLTSLLISRSTAERDRWRTR